MARLSNRQIGTLWLFLCMMYSAKTPPVSDGVPCGFVTCYADFYCDTVRQDCSPCSTLVGPQSQYTGKTFLPCTDFFANNRKPDKEVSTSKHQTTSKETPTQLTTKVSEAVVYNGGISIAALTCIIAAVSLILLIGTVVFIVKKRYCTSVLSWIKCKFPYAEEAGNNPKPAQKEKSAEDDELAVNLIERKETGTTEKGGSVDLHLPDTNISPLDNVHYAETDTSLSMQPSSVQR